MRHRIAVAIVLGSLALTSEASAGNAETFYLGNDAALLAGAASASVQGASAVWYNPARIQEGHADSIDVSGSAYLLRFGGSPQLEAAPGVPASRTSLVTLDFTAVPTALAIKRDVLGLHVAAGVFVPNRTVSYPRTLVRLTPRDQPPIEVALDSNSHFSEYYAGFGVGADIAPNLSLGMSVFGYYSSEVDTASFTAHSGASILDSGGTLDEQRLGLQAVTGLAWHAAPRLRLAFVLRSPVLQLLDQTQASTRTLAAGTTGNAAQIDFAETGLAARSSLLTPLRAEAGVAIDATRATTVAADAKMRGLLAGVSVPMLDVRAGARSRVGRNTWVGAGLFTDRNALSQTQKLEAAAALDFYGGTLALELGTPYRVTDAEQKASTMVFSTAFALSYAIGLGSVGNAFVTPAANGGVNLVPQRQDVVAHEFMFLIGSSVSMTNNR